MVWEGEREVHVKRLEESCEVCAGVVGLSCGVVVADVRWRGTRVCVGVHGNDYRMCGGVGDRSSVKLFHQGCVSV
eukprot:6458738-Alexandrium_andersonii.AAC.1